MAEWLFICSKCGHRIEQDEVIDSKCPSCGATSWLCHLLDRDNHNQSISVADGVSATEKAEKPKQSSFSGGFVTSISATGLEISCNKTQGRVKHSGGRPRAEVSVKKVMAMQSQGRSLRYIAKELGVSHMTIGRILKGRD